MFETYSGATKIVPLLGFPIEQTKSPYGMTQGFAARGADCIVVPVKVSPDAVNTYLKAIDHVENLAGVLATVPHKFALAAHADRLTERATFYGSANIMRRDSAGRWIADMLDGLGFVRAIQAAGGTIADARVLLAGAGGAGGAIALAVLEAGATSISIHDVDHGRRDDLIERLAHRFPGKASLGTRAPDGFDLIINATPLGMRPGDPAPIDLAGLRTGMFVGDVVTATAITPLVAAATTLGCRNCSGHAMFDATLELMLDFFLGAAE